MADLTTTQVDAKIYQHAEKLKIHNIGKTNHAQFISLTRSLGQTDIKTYAHAERLGVKNIAKADHKQKLTLLRSLVSSTPAPQLQSSPKISPTKVVAPESLETKAYNKELDTRIYAHAEQVGIKNISKADPKKLHSLLRSLLNAVPPIHKTSAVHDPHMDFGPYIG